MDQEEVLRKNAKLSSYIEKPRYLVSDNAMYKKYAIDLLKFPFENREHAFRAFKSVIRIDNLDNFLNQLNFYQEEEIPLEAPFTIRAVRVSKNIVAKAEESVACENEFENDSSSFEDSDERVFEGNICIENQDLWIQNKKIIEDATFTIVRGRIYGLVGKNGIGKSTLLKAIRKRRFGISKGLHMYLVKQEDRIINQKVLDFVLDGNFDDFEAILNAKRILADVGFCIKDEPSSDVKQNMETTFIHQNEQFNSTLNLSNHQKTSETSKDKENQESCQHDPSETNNGSRKNSLFKNSKSSTATIQESSRFIQQVDQNDQKLQRNVSNSEKNISTQFKKMNLNGKPKIPNSSEMSNISIYENTKNLSGGWCVRASLAKAIFKSPELLLLDEPTNMLDFPTIVWLENAIKKLNTTVIIVSHDREFLNNVCTDILHLNDMKIQSYKGNYDSFVHHRKLKLENQQKEYEKQVEYRKHLQDFIDRFRYNSKRASLAQSKIKILENMVLIEPVKKEATIKFTFKSSVAKGNLIEFKNAFFGYKIRSDALENHKNFQFNIANNYILENIEFKITNKSRVVIVGPNGAGKSTFLRLISKKLEVNKGTVIYNPHVKPGYFTQHHIDQLNLNESVLDFFHKKTKLKDDEMRKFMSQFNLVADVQKIGTLSGGQKSRLAFSILSATEPNLLILDEPTNHLDIESIDALGVSLKNFEGAVIAVSHDLKFIESSFDEVWVCDKKKLTFFNGSIRDYKNTLLSKGY